MIVTNFLYTLHFDRLRWVKKAKHYLFVVCDPVAMVIEGKDDKMTFDSLFENLLWVMSTVKGFQGII